MFLLDNENKYSALYSKRRKTTLIQKSYANNPIEFTYKFISFRKSIHEIKGHSKDMQKPITDAKWT